MKIQFFSDLHLEFGPLEPPHTAADVVVAAGDIHVQDEGLDWLAALEKPVIYVAGNHELWNGDLQAGLENLRERCAGTNIHFLENNQVSIGEVTFFGCSLWTDFAGEEPQIKRYGGAMMNDFNFITSNGRRTGPDDVIALNRASVDWLASRLRRENERTPVVVTHHAPSRRSWAFDADDPIQFAYCNDLDALMEETGVPLWFHGHVHAPADYRVGETRVLCNPRGYFPFGLVEEFDPDKTVEV